METHPTPSRQLAPIDVDALSMFQSDYALPPLPAIAMKIRDMIEQDDCNATEVAELVSKDPALAAKLLRMVNSAYYGLPREVSDVKFAIAFVGLGEVYRIVMALAVIESIGVADTKELEDFWYHSYLSTLISKNVSVRFQPHLPLDELWSAALLHDIGRLVYARFFPDHLRATRSYARAAGCTHEAAEKALGVPSSATLGVLLCQYWNLPNRIRDACRYHAPDSLQAFEETGTLRGDFIRAVCIGHTLSQLSVDELNDQVRVTITQHVMETLGCDERTFLDLMAEVYEWREEVSGFIRNMV